MQRALAWMVVPCLAACGRLAFDAPRPAPDDETPVGGCPLVLNLDRAQIEEPLIDFPLLVRLGSDHLDRTQLQPDARNLEFHLDGTTLAYEIEDAGDPVLAWVRVPVLSGSGLAIRVGYSAGTAAAASQRVWSAQYAAVFHLAETLGTPRDATGHYAAASIAELGSSPIAGWIGGGREFRSAQNDAVQIDAPDLVYSAFTVSGWMYERTLPTAYHALVTREHDKGPDNFFWIGDYQGSYVGEVYRSLGGLSLRSSKRAMGNSWVHLALTATSDPANSSATLFINGEMDVFQSVPDLPSPSTERPIVLGADNNSGAENPDVDWLDGYLDEVRIETVARSPAWMHADYLSMADQLIRYEVPTAALPCD